MPDSRPAAADLLAGVVGYLERDLLPGLDGRHRYLVRVAANAIRIVQRELSQRPALDAEERQRLARLLGEDGPLEAMNRELARRIRDGEIALDDPALLDHLKRAIAGALAINNPRWIKPEE